MKIEKKLNILPFVYTHVIHKSQNQDESALAADVWGTEVGCGDGYGDVAVGLGEGVILWSRLCWWEDTKFPSSSAADAAGLPSGWEICVSHLLGICLFWRLL